MPFGSGPVALTVGLSPFVCFAHPHFPFDRTDWHDRIRPRRITTSTGRQVSPANDRSG
ncbi:exported protein of unknown function [Azospirillum lipoferum 4B]|uniref:Uncharacterized protein n=1 Tax=Azospirillum lipoferum (strain 4B) TaxID=862719 RepID=G7Z6R7_AZOL4|nr:exported protein of unknown function [Azospirillum lipoferum 4B]